MGTKPQSAGWFALVALTVWTGGATRDRTILNIARIGPNTIFWIFGKGFFLIAPVGLLLQHMTKEFERNFKKIRIFKRVAYLVFIILWPRVVLILRFTFNTKK
jgi:hypothetical protein